MRVTIPGSQLLKLLLSDELLTTIPRLKRMRVTIPGSQLLQLLLSDELLPEGELPLVLCLLQALPGGVDVSDHLALAGRVWNLQNVQI
jgi:hypothetical protein